MSDRKALQDLIEAVAPLVDPEGSVSAFHSAWEFDHHLDGKDAHERLREAYDAAVTDVTPGP